MGTRAGVARLPGLSTTVVSDDAGLAALAGEWAELYRAAPRATPFQSHAWLSAWSGAYGRPGTLRIVLVRDGDRLVAAAPLQLTRRGPVRVLAPLGGEITDFTDVLIAEGDDADPAAATAALARALLAVPGWDVLELPEVRAGGAAELLRSAWTGPTWSVPASSCAEMTVTSWDDLLSQLPSKRARDARRVLRRSDELGLTAAAVPVGEVAEAITELLRLHAAQWAGRGVNPEHLTSRFAQHLRTALPAMVADGAAVLTRYRLDGEVLAVELLVVGTALTGGYLIGADPVLYQRTDFFSFVLRHDVELTARLGVPRYSMLRGRESYKDKWQPETLVNSQLLLGRPGAPLARVAGLRAQLRARAVVELRARPELRAKVEKVLAKLGR